MLVFNVEALSVIRLLFTYHNSAPRIPLNNICLSLEWHSCSLYTPSCRMNSIKSKFQFWRRLHRLNLPHHRPAPQESQESGSCGIRCKWEMVCGCSTARPKLSFKDFYWENLQIRSPELPALQHRENSHLLWATTDQSEQLSWVCKWEVGVGQNVCITRVEVDATWKMSLSIMFLLKWLRVKPFVGILKFPHGKACSHSEELLNDVSGYWCFSERSSRNFTWPVSQPGAVTVWTAAALLRRSLLFRFKS